MPHIPPEATKAVSRCLEMYHKEGFVFIVPGSLQPMPPENYNKLSFCYIMVYYPKLLFGVVEDSNEQRLLNM